MHKWPHKKQFSTAFIHLLNLALSLTIFTIPFNKTIAQSIPQALRKALPAEITQKSRIVAANFDAKTRQIQLWATAGASVLYGSPEALKTLQLPGPIIKSRISPRRKYIAVLVKPGARGEGQQPVQLQLFDLNGQSLLRHQLVMGADELPPVVAINDQPRRMVLGRPSTNELIYLDATGREIFRTHLLRNSPFSWERSMQAVFADSGTHFAVATMQEPARPENPFAHRNVHVFMYAANGHLLWHKILPEQSLGALAIARDAAYLAVATYDSYTQPGKIMQKTRIFNLAGREIAAAPILFKQAHFLPGRPHVVFHSNRTLWRLDLDSGHFTPLLQVRKPGEQILAATFSGRTNQWAVALGKSVFAAGHFQFASPSLLILNPEGKEVNRLTWEGQSLRAPFVSPSQAGSQILLFFENHLEIYPWNP